MRDRVELYDLPAEKNKEINHRDHQDRRSLNLQRNINLRDLKLEGFETWVTFDDQPFELPATSTSLLGTKQADSTAYSTAHIDIKDGVVHR
jgi:hypothetical protein